MQSIYLAQIQMFNSTLDDGKISGSNFFHFPKFDSLTKKKKKFKILKYSINSLSLRRPSHDLHTKSVTKISFFLFFALIHSRFSYFFFRFRFFFFFFVFLYVEIYYNRVLKSHSTKVSQPIIISSSVYFVVVVVNI